MKHIINFWKWWKMIFSPIYQENCYISKEEVNEIVELMYTEFQVKLFEDMNQIH